MRNFVMVVFLMFCWTAAAQAAPIWLNDYHGTIGDGDNQKVIGLTISKEGHNLDEGCTSKQIKGAAMYYKHDLEDIALIVTSRDERDVTFKTVDYDGGKAGTLDLRFVEKDPQNSYKTDEPLCEEVLVGTWTPEAAEGETAKPVPVYLRSAHAVAGQPDGGRCYMSRDAYLKTEKRIQQFQKAIAEDDKQTLQREFGYSKVLSDEYKKLITDDIAHNLFCKDDGIMLGSGVVWFDEQGNVINP